MSSNPVDDAAAGTITGARPEAANRPRPWHRRERLRAVASASSTQASQNWAGLVALGLYIVAAVVSAQFRGGSWGAAAIWFPAGLAFMVLRTTEVRRWPVLLVVSIAVHIWMMSPVLALAVAVGDTAGAVIGVLALSRLGARATLEAPRDAWALFLAAAALPAVVPATLVTLAVMFTTTTGQPIMGVYIWALSWAGWTLGVIFMVPPASMMLRLRWRANADAYRYALWGLAGVALLIVAAAVAFTAQLPATPGLTLAFLPLPMALLLVARGRFLEAAGGMVIVAAIAVAATLSANGPFGALGPNDALALVQAYVAVNGFTVLLIGSILTNQRRAEQSLEDQVATRTTALSGLIADLQREVADRQRAEDALRMADQELRRAQALAGLGSWHLDLRSNSLVCSDQFLLIHGNPERELKATRRGFLQLVHEEDRGRFEQAIFDLLDTREGEDVQYRIVRPDGIVRYMLGHMELETDTDGAPERLFGVAQDITDRLQAQKKFETFVESAPDAMVMVDAEGRIVLANRRFVELFGYQKEEILGEPVEKLVPSRFVDAHEGHRHGYTAHPSRRPMGAGRDLFARRKDGSEFPVEISLSPIETEEGTHTSAAIRDITDRHKAAEADRLAFQRLLEIEHLRSIDRAKTRLLNTASHELNTPITPLKMQTFLLASEKLGPLTDQQRQAIGVLERNIDRLALLVGDVLDVARLQGGALKVRLAPIDLGTVIRETVETLEGQAAEESIGLSIATEGDMQVMADSDRITQVILNLVGNALKFTPEGGTIAVEARRGTTDVTISVIDSGVGLTAEQIDLLFQPFSQVHDPMERTRSGTGLGLYICRGIIEQHGGSITCSSKGPGTGTTFMIRFPAKPPATGKSAKGRNKRPARPSHDDPANARPPGQPPESGAGDEHPSAPASARK